MNKIHELQAKYTAKIQRNIDIIDQMNERMAREEDFKKQLTLMEQVRLSAINIEYFDFINDLKALEGVL